MEYQKKASLKSIVASARMTFGVSVCYSYSPTQDSPLDTGVVSGGKAVRCIYIRSGSRSIYGTRPSMIDPSCPIKNRLASALAQIHNLRPIQSTVNCPNPTSPSIPSFHNENSNSQGLSLTKNLIAKSSVPNTFHVICSLGFKVRNTLLSALGQVRRCAPMGWVPSCRCPICSDTSLVARMMHPKAE